MTDAKAPHKAVILLQMEVHEVLPTGECSAKLVGPNKLKEFGLSPKFVVNVEGENR